MPYQPSGSIDTLAKYRLPPDTYFKENPLGGFVIGNTGKTHLMIGSPHDCRLIEPGEAITYFVTDLHNGPCITRLAQ